MITYMSTYYPLTHGPPRNFPPPPPAAPTFFKCIKIFIIDFIVKLIILNVFFDLIQLFNVKLFDPNKHVFKKKKQITEISMESPMNIKVFYW